MKLFFLSLSCWLFFTLFASAQWQPVTLPVSGEDVFGISFVTDTTAYISSDSKIVYTADNFSSFTVKPWSVYYFGSPIPFFADDLHELHFTSVTDGYLTGAFDLFNEYAILHTDDGAQTWDIIFDDNSGPIFRYIIDMDFRNNTALACGAHGKVLRSSNGGTSWGYVSSPASQDLTQIVFINNNDAICVGQGVLMRSSDGGVTWSIDPAYASNYFWDAEVVSNGNVVYASTSDEIFYSSDGGVTFSSTTPSFSEINCIAAKGTDTLFAGTSAGIYVSFNHGGSWLQFTSTQSYHINRMEIRGDDVFALCNGGYVLRNSLDNLQAEPLANFDVILNETCGVTTMQVNSLSDAQLQYEWYVDGNLQSVSSSGFTIDYFSDANVNVKLIVSNSSASDTMEELQYITVNQNAILPSQPDISGCYGQEFIVGIAPQPGQTYNYSSPLVDSGVFYFMIDTLYMPACNQNSYVIFKANNAGNCPVYDTVNFYVSPQVLEPFQAIIPSTLNPNDMSSLDAVNDTLLYAVNDAGYLFKSTDAGATWTSHYVDSDISSTNTIDFVNENVGYIAAANLKTINGGQTFTNLTALNSYGGYSGRASFINADTGLLGIQTSSFSVNQWVIMKTQNGGQTFTNITPQTFYCWIGALKMLSNNVIFVAGGSVSWFYDPVLKKSSDGGNSWIDIPIPATYGLTGLSVISEDTLFAFALDDYVYRTYDGGATWTTYWLGGDACGCIGVLNMVNSKIGYLQRGDARIYKTENGGDCWTTVSTITTPNAYPNNITCSPSGNQIFICSNNVYSYKTSAFLEVSIDSSWCVGSPIYTHNVSSGYTAYEWYLDGIPYSDERDTVFSFNQSGNHEITMIADSAGELMDTVQFSITIVPAIGSIGNISGPTSACTQGGFFTTTYSAGSNPNITQYHWWSNSPGLILSGLASTDSVANIVFAPNANFSTFITLYVTGFNENGCYADDTASFVVHLVNHAPQSTITVTGNLSDCYYLPENSFYSTNAFDTVACQCSADPLADSYYFNGVQWFTTSAEAPLYPYCPGNSFVVVAASNACGISAQNAYLPIDLFYVPNQVIHTPDTIVMPYDPVNLYFYPYTNTDIIDYCGNPQIWWTEPAGYSYETDWFYYYIDPMTWLDTGTYKVDAILGCDTVTASFHVGFSVFTAADEMTTGTFYANYDQGSETISVHFEPLNDDATLSVFDMNGKINGVTSLKAGTSSYNIPAVKCSQGIYMLELRSAASIRKCKIAISR